MGLYLLSLIEWRCVWLLSKMLARMDFVSCSDMVFVENAVTKRRDSYTYEL